MKPSSQRWQWRPCLTGVVIFGCIIGCTLHRALADEDDIIVIRCVGYEQPMVSFFESGKPGSYPPKTEPFDIHISPSRHIGWWSSPLIRIDEDRPAKLSMDIDHYELTATGTLGEVPMTERVHLDRIGGTMGNYLAIKGDAVKELRRGGTCSKLEPKF
jgi:hypothetical protein